MSRSLIRSVLELRTPITRLPPAYLLPIRAHTRSLTTANTARPVKPAPPAVPAASAKKPAASAVPAAPAVPAVPAIPTAAVPHLSQQSAQTAIFEKTKGPLPLTGNIPKTQRPDLYPREPQDHHPAPTPAQATELRTLLPLLRAQPSHYVRAHVYGFAYLVTPGDLVRLPFQMPGVVPGDVLRLDRASVLGSRDFTLKGAPYLDERLFECRAVVTGTESEPLRVKVKSKRRTRRSQRVTSKHKYTMLRISEIKVKGPEAIGL